MVFLPRISDLYGRVKMLKIANALSVVAFGTLIVTDSYHILIATLLILGATSTVRKTVMSIYLYENMSKNNYTYM